MDNSTKTVTPRSVGIKYGLISALTFTALFLILVLLGQDSFDNMWGWVKMAIGVAILIFAQRNFKNDGDGYMSYGQGITIGLVSSIVSVAIVGIVTLLYVNFIDPHDSLSWICFMISK